MWISAEVSSAGEKASGYRARTYFRDFDGYTREVAARGRTRRAAESRLLEKLRERVSARYGGTLRAADQFSTAAEVWIDRIQVLVADGRRSPGTLETYRRHLERHVLPALGSVRLGEISPPLLDHVLHRIRSEVSPSTARSCRSVISGVLGVAVRHGAIATNPAREVDRIENRPGRQPRALTAAERQAWFEALNADAKAVAADLPDLTAFMLATGVRIGEALGVTWENVDFNTREVAITGQVIRIRGLGLVRGRTKSRSGERILRLPDGIVQILHRRRACAAAEQDPVFCDALGGFRDPSNVRRAIREARTPVGGQSRRDLGALLMNHRRRAQISRKDAAAALGAPRTRIELIETARVQVDSHQIEQLADLYRVRGADRVALLELANQASKDAPMDALSWVTSHSFRKTTATILDEAGQSARQIADQLGHARPSLTQDVYMGRKAKNTGAAAVLERALTSKPGSNPDGFPDGVRVSADPENP